MFTFSILIEIKMFLEFSQTPGMSPSTVWESLKAYVRGQIISYCANKKRASTECIKKVADEILELDRRQSHSPSTDLIKKRLPLQSSIFYPPIMLNTLFPNQDTVIMNMGKSLAEHLLTSCVKELQIKPSLKLTMNVA